MAQAGVSVSIPSARPNVGTSSKGKHSREPYVWLSPTWGVCTARQTVGTCVWCREEGTRKSRENGGR